MVEDRRRFNDGKYHYVRFTRTGDSAVLRVDDDLEMASSATSGGTSGNLTLRACVVASSLFVNVFLNVGIAICFWVPTHLT